MIETWMMKGILTDPFDELWFTESRKNMPFFSSSDEVAAIHMFK